MLAAWTLDHAGAHVLISVLSEGTASRPQALPQRSSMCLNTGMERPSWWCYPVKCSRGHEWGPGKVIVSWKPCDCQSAKDSGKLGHLMVSCQELGGCPSRWYSPRHDSATATPLSYPARF